MPLVAVEGDTDTQDGCHGDNSGGGTYSIPASTQQSIMRVNGKKVITKGEPFSAHETAYAGDNSPCSPILRINGKPAVRSGDISRSSSCHTFSGIATNQSILKA